MAHCQTGVPPSPQHLSDEQAQRLMTGIRSVSGASFAFMNPVSDH